jgi:hypothetical protein
LTLRANASSPSMVIWMCRSKLLSSGTVVPLSQRTMKALLASSGRLRASTGWSSGRMVWTRSRSSSAQAWVLSAGRGENSIVRKPSIAAITQL